MKELHAYDPKMAKLSQIVAINKSDTIDKETQDLLVKELKDSFKKKKLKIGKLFIFSSVTGEGLKKFMFYLWEEVQKLAASPATVKKLDSGYRVFRPHLEVDSGGFDVKKVENEFFVTGKRIEQIVVMTNFGNRSAIFRVYDVMEKMGILKKIRSMGAELGNVIHIGEGIFEFRG